MDTTLLTILVFGLLMSLIAIIGELFIFLPKKALKRWMKPIVAFAAGSLLGGAFGPRFSFLTRRPVNSAMVSLK